MRILPINFAKYEEPDSNMSVWSASADVTISGGGNNVHIGAQVGTRMSGFSIYEMTKDITFSPMLITPTGLLVPDPVVSVLAKSLKETLYYKFLELTDNWK